MSIETSFKKEIQERFKERALFDEPLSKWVAYRVGGPADVLVFPETEEEIDWLSLKCRNKNVPLTIIGTGTNLLVRDEGIRGVVLSLLKANQQIELLQEPQNGKCLVRCGGGVEKPALLDWAVERSFAGLEFSSGVPGTVGGGIFMNAGTKYGCYGDILKRLRLYDFQTGPKEYDRSEFQMGYRHQTLIKNSLVMWVILELQLGNREMLRNEVNRIIAERAEKQPLEHPSCGSTFKNPEGFSAGRLIEKAGIKGWRIGGAEISTKHANFILNKGNAYASDILALIHLAKEKVKKDFAIDLETEVIILGVNMEEKEFRTPVEFTKSALVFSGGATKAAAFHVGVCLALRDKGFSFVGGRSENPAPVNSLPYPRPKYHPHQIATYVGSSAGALIVGMLAAGLSIESIINSFVRDADFKVPGDHSKIPRIAYKDMLAVHWPKPTTLLNPFRKSSFFGKTLESAFRKYLRYPGIFSTRGLAEYLKRHVLPTDHFYELKPDLYVVGTQLDHSRKIIFGRYTTRKTYDGYARFSSSATISDAIAASMSLPPIYAPYSIEHENGKKRYYIDGEIRETLSAHVAMQNGCDLIFCSYTHQPYHYTKDTGSLYDYGIPAIIIQAIYQSIEQKIYAHRKARERRQETLETVRNFFKEKELSQEMLDELIALLKKKLDFDEQIRLIYIHPDAKDHEMFFGDHFTLNNKTLQTVVTLGYKRAMAALRKYDLIPKTS